MGGGVSVMIPYRVDSARIASKDGFQVEGEEGISEAHIRLGRRGAGSISGWKLQQLGQDSSCHTIWVS